MARGGAGEPQDYDLPGHNLGGPKDRREAGRYGNFLRTVRGIGDHTAADRAAMGAKLSFIVPGAKVC